MYRPDQPRVSDDRGWSDGWDADTARTTAFPPLSDGDREICYNPATERYCIGDNAPTDVLFFGSAHRAGMNAAFGDGSVQFVSFSVDHIVFNSHGTRNGKEVVSSGDL
jgi:prepilin-type processing-associated H-X9-DG protein